MRYAESIAEWRLPTGEELRDAAALVRRYMPPTPQYSWPQLSKEAGCELWIKHENHTPTGSFKIRGGLVLLASLRRNYPEIRSVVTATRGNHGQSIAFAGAHFGLTAVVVVPRGNSTEKNDAMSAMGAEVIEYGTDFHEADRQADELANVSQLFKIPSFHPLLVRGVGTYALELFEAVRDIDVVYVPIGWGSGACGLAAARNALGLKTQVIGVVSSQSPSFRRSFAAGVIVDVPTRTQIADGIAISRPHPRAFELVRGELEDVVEVSDDAIRSAMRAYFRATHNVAEGAGAASLAAVLQERERLAGKKVVAILTGGNVDADIYSQILSQRGVLQFPTSARCSTV